MTSKPQHLVSLLSIEDDALGEELQVVWELDHPGAKVIEMVAIPEPADSDSMARHEAPVNGIRQDADTMVLEPLEHS